MKKKNLTDTELKQKAQNLAQRLEETEEQTLQVIEKIYQLMGEEFAEEFYEKTEGRQSSGGLNTMDKKRRRTKGGVFFYLVKEVLPEKLKNQIFIEEEEEGSHETQQTKNPSLLANNVQMIESNLSHLRESEAKSLAAGKDASLTQLLIQRTEKLLQQAKTGFP
jgi:hypothetical protein